MEQLEHISDVTFFGLPVVVMDDDFFEFLEENSIETSMELNEFGVYLHQWLKEECE